MNWQLSVRLRLGALDLDVDLHGGLTPVALVGPNGSGKTTLLRIIAGAHRPDAGRVQIGEQVLFDAAAKIDLPPEARQIGYVPQGFGLFPHLRVLDNVAFGLIGQAKSERRQAALKTLQALGCAQLASRWPTALSGGETQRVALARALLAQPRILLLDEPLSALDAQARRSMRRYLADHLAQTGLPTVLVTHDARDVLALNADVFVIERGRIVQHGKANELAAAPATAFVAELFDSPLGLPLQSPQEPQEPQEKGTP